MSASQMRAARDTIPTFVGDYVSNLKIETWRLFLMFGSFWKNWLSYPLFVIGALALGCDDSSGPNLPPQPDAGNLNQVVILAPTNNAELTATDDLDGDVTNGLQFKVSLDISLVSDGTLQLNVGDSMPQVVDVESGPIELDASVPFDRNGSYPISAVLTPAEGDPVSAEIRVQVRSFACSITVNPQPSGVGCDLGASADEDSVAPGFQTTLSAQTSCPEVVFTVNNLPAITAQTVDGVANQQVTLRDGENTITISANDGLADPTVVGPYPLSVRTTGPQFELNDFNGGRVNTRLIAEGEQDGGLIYWAIQGRANGVEPGARVQLSFEPALDNAPADARVDENGQFRFEVAVARGAFYSGDLTLSATDICGEAGESDAYTIRLDAVVPTAQIIEPSDGSLLVFSLDLEPTRAGAQIPVSIDLIDPRPSDVDYPISIECAAVSGSPVFVDRARGPGDAINRSDLLDDDPTNDAVIVTFQQSEQGEFICRTVIGGTSNPSTAREVVWRAFFDRPSFSLFTPARAPSCVRSDEVDFAGTGMDLDGNQPALSATITSPQLDDDLVVGFEPRGGERYGFALDALELPDGEYAVSLSGQVLGQVDVDIEPQEFSVIVDRQGPTVSILSPDASATFVDEDPATAGTQSGLRFEVCGAGGQELNITTLPALAGSPYIVNIPADAECSTVSLPPTTVPLGDVLITAGVTDRCNVQASASMTASISPSARESRILTPTPGFVNANSDTDNNRAGCQFELTAVGQGMAEGAEFFVCTNVQQTAPIGQCNGASSALAGACRITGSTENGAQVACPLTLVDGQHDITFVGIFGDRVESAPVALNIDCQAPSVTQLTLVDDADNDGCINQMERRNQGAPGTAAQFQVRVQTEGFEDGQVIRLLTEDGVSQGSVALVNNQGNITVQLAEGTRTLNVTGSDLAGNSVATEGVDVVTLPLQVDTTAPTPSLTNIVQAACLNATADEDENTAGLQYSVQINTGREQNDTVTARMVLDGIEIATQQAQTDTVDFAAQTFAEGAHNLAVTVTDGCSNVGSVSGFAQVNGVDDWTQPIAVPVLVDTIAPNLSIDGLLDGAILTAIDDADANSANGFQVDLVAQLDAAAPIEEGEQIDLTINGAPAETSPSPLLAPAAGQIVAPVRVTLSPGVQTMQLSAADVCGNAGTSATVSVELQIPGCTSNIGGFDTNPAILGAADGIRSGNELTLDINGRVDLLDQACVGAQILLLVDGEQVADSVVPDGGVISFPAVTFIEGQRNVRFRVRAADDSTLDSPNQALSVDLSSPTLSVVQPLDGASLLTDSDAATAGQQALIQVNVTENSVVTARTALLRVDGAAIGEPIAINSDSPTLVNFAGVTLNAGNRSLQLCVTDEAGNAGCANWSVNADPAAPSAVSDLLGQINDRRSTDVSLTFTAPGDDGDAGGQVLQYAVRRADAAIGDENAWQNAASSELVVPATLAPGGQELISLTGVGPGPAIQDGLQQNKIHHLAVRAMDDAGRMSEISQVVVDLTMNQRTANVEPILGQLDDSDFFNQGSQIIGAGDLDGDGLNDTLVVGSQAAASVASLIFGALDQDALTVLPLEIPDSILQGFFGLGAANIGDVNGDGAADFAVIGVQNGFAGSAIVIYFGCDGACDRSTLATPDALITANNGRLISVVAAAGNFNQRAGDGASLGDIFLGGSISAQQNPTTAFVVSGRADWPVLPDSIVLDDDPANSSDGVIVLTVPDGKAGYAGASAGNISGDARDDLVFSAGNPSVIYRFNGGVDLPDSITYVPNNPDTAVVPHVCSADPDGYGEHIIGGKDLDGDPGGIANFAVADGINRRVVVFDENDQPIDCFGRSRALFGNVFDFAGDLDGDGFEDLIVTHADTDADAFVFYNDGLGQFGDGAAEAPRGAHIIFDEPDLPKIGVAGLGDTNNDGRDDVGAVVKQPGDVDLQLIIYQ
ncbi:MAG: VCBS repeat-containing protein [Myxococcota bacterium]|nr:VCBS repeat-containing protein [Myxococcota bacterium]